MRTELLLVARPEAPYKRGQGNELVVKESGYFIVAEGKIRYIVVKGHSTRFHTRKVR